MPAISRRVDLRGMDCETIDNIGTYARKAKISRAEVIRRLWQLRENVARSEASHYLLENADLPIVTL